LGDEDGAAERAASARTKPRETSWLRSSSSTRHVTPAGSLGNAGSASHVLQTQPRHSPESDLFYDIEMKQEKGEEEEKAEEMTEDGAGSPAEEATTELARLLVNCPDILKTNYACHCSPSESRTMMTSDVTTDARHDSETSCSFVSPITGTSSDSESSSEMFFDPKSWDTDCLRSEFDQNTSNISKIITSRVSKRSRRLKGFEKLAFSTHPQEQASFESSCSLPRRIRGKGGSAYCIGEQISSSEENSELNGRSSQETTTSPSHESLWSTFDESTLSLQDDSPFKISCDFIPVPRTYLPKSHSDSELSCKSVVDATASDRLNDRRNEDGDEENVDNKVDFPRSNGLVDASRFEDGDDGSCNYSENVTDKKKTVSEEEESIESEKAHDSSQLKTEGAITDHHSDAVCDSTVDIANAVKSASEAEDGKVERNGASDEAKPRTDDTPSGSDEEKKLRLLLRKLNSGNSSTQEEEEDTSPEQECQGGEAVEEEEDRPQRVRRCSSLKTGKTPPGTPRRKKFVRFADKLGLDLADVRTFLDEIPRIPNSAYNDLIYDDATFRQQDSAECADWGERRCGYQEDIIRRRSVTSSPRKLDRMLVPLFQQPGGMANFLDVVRERRVCLENALVQDPVTLAIQGTVRVINIDYHKSVHIRYTLNAWQNFSDLQAVYVPNSCDGFSDKFSFVLYCHTLTVGQRLEFAVRFQCKGAQYWDNNAGANYCFQCLPASSPTYTPIIADEEHRGNWSPVFY